VALIKVRNKQTKDIAHVAEEWLERWPDDYERVEAESPRKKTPTPVAGTNKKEKP